MTETKDITWAHISLAHGNGGRYMRELIETIFSRYLSNPVLNTQADAASLPDMEGNIMISTDGFTVQPLEFPGGDIGSLSIHGTLNDLAVAGAIPKYMTVNVFIEEGLEVSQLERIVQSMASAAKENNIAIVAGDTKVVPKGQGSGLYLATTGIGIKSGQHTLNIKNINIGDRIVVSGPVGDHGTAIMLAREEFGMHGALQSDAASVLPLTQAVDSIAGLKFMRDPTRGGLATVMHEIQQASGLGVYLYEEQIPIRDEVQTVCDMLGYDPLYLACEGRVVAVVDDNNAEALLACWQQLPQGQEAAIIGKINQGNQVVLRTTLGGERLLDELEDDPLPRIC
ncbi:MAG: hydrogenase expression/formation protein HypE [Gammaproteobacteria bacterium]|nr:hydrogenase expression/formation protein HypE [Gammaproteobacteria bacterium]